MGVESPNLVVSGRCLDFGKGGYTSWALTIVINGGMGPLLVNFIGKMVVPFP